jgi:ATP-binding protein involved in chromosome partitioning
MAGYQCPHCGETSEPFGSGGAEAARPGDGDSLPGRIPLRLSIRKASDAGTPSAAGEGEEAAMFRDIARNLRSR